jgi:hypothetical protein
MLKQVLTTSLALTSVLLGAGQAMAGSFFIDNFNQPLDNSGNVQDLYLGGTPPGNLSNQPEDPFAPTGPNPDVRTSLPDSSVIGGSRSLKLEKLTGSAGFTRARVLPGTNGSLAINNDSGVTSKTTLLWNNDGAGLDNAGQGNFLEKLGTSTGRFGINFKSPAVGTFKATINIMDSAGELSDVPVNNLAASTTYNQFLLSDFIAKNPLINLNSVRYIELVLESSAGGSVDIADIGLYEIPEPSALAGSIFALGLGVTFLRRRQENND